MSAKGYTRNYKPLELMTEEQMQSVHRSALDVLEVTGARFESERALQLFEKNGCKVDWDNRRVRIPPGLVEECLRMTPSSFHLKAKNPKDDLIVGGPTTYFCPSPGMRAVDLATWLPRLPTVQENDDDTKVLEGLENVHTALSYTPYCEIEGVPPVMMLPVSCAGRMKYFTKPCRIGQASESWIWEIQMAQAVGIDVYGAVESAPPLTWYDDAIGCAFATAEAGYPIELGCGAVMGGTGPATIAGVLVLSNAELLSGLVLSQLIRNRIPIIADCFVFPQNMRTGAPGFGGIEVSLFQAMFNQMWRKMYNIPTMLGACGPSSSKCIDYQAGYEKSISVVLAAVSGASIINVLGSLSSELTWHPALAVLDNDMVGMTGRFLEGARIDNETLAVDLIEQVGPLPGFYLGTEHTRKWWKQEQFLPKAADRSTYPEWLKTGKKTALDLAQERVAQLKASYRRATTDREVEDIDRILCEAEQYYRAKGLL